MGVAQGADSTNPAVHHCWPCWKCFIWDGPRHWHANEACSDWPLSIDFRALKDFVQCVSRNFRLFLFGAQTNCPICPDRNESKASDTSVAWDEPQNAKSSALVAAEQLRHEWYVLVALPRTCTITFAKLLSIMTVSSFAVLVCDSPEVCQVIAKLSISCRFCFRPQPFSAKRCSVDCDMHLHMDGVLELRSLNSFFCCRWGSAGLKLALVSRLCLTTVLMIFTCWFCGLRCSLITGIPGRFVQDFPESCQKELQLGSKKYRVTSRLFGLLQWLIYVVSSKTFKILQMVLSVHAVQFIRFHPYSWVLGQVDLYGCFLDDLRHSSTMLQGWSAPMTGTVIHQSCSIHGDVEVELDAPLLFDAAAVPENCWWNVCFKYR